MANSSEDSSDAHTSNPNQTSKVRSVPFQMMQEQMALMREIRQTLTQKLKEKIPRVKPKEISLPLFNLKIAGMV
jgi:uncharacterized protein YecA (UPF0149 family)